MIALVPFTRKQCVFGPQIIEAGKEPVPLAVWATASSSSLGWGPPVRVDFRAQPPNGFAAIQRHFVGGQWPVCSPVPFVSEVWASCRDVILACSHAAAGALRAPLASCSGRDSRRVTVVLSTTKPPGHVPAAGRDGIGTAGVAFAIPLCGKIRTKGSKIIDSRPGSPAGTIRAP